MIGVYANSTPLRNLQYIQKHKVIAEKGNIHLAVDVTYKDLPDIFNH